MVASSEQRRVVARAVAPIWWQWPLLIASAALVAFSAVGFADAQSKMPDVTQRLPIPVGSAPSIGPADAPVTIVEFSDFYCPYCRRANQTLNTLLEVYPKSVRVVFRHSLLDADGAHLAALATMVAADRGKFWPMHDRLFAGPTPTSVDGLVRAAADVGLDAVSFRRALESDLYKGKLKAELLLAKQLGLSGVPMFFVNGRPISGAQPLSVFARLINEEIGLATSLTAAGVKPAEVYSTLINNTHAAVADKTLIGNDELFARGLEGTVVYPVGAGREANRLGSKEPLVTIVEFSDFDCGYCARAHPILKSVVERFPADVALVYRHYPLGRGSRLVLEAAEAAGAQGKFWQFSSRLFNDEGAHASLAPLVQHAQAIGLDLKRFTRELASRTHRQTVLQDATEAASYGVHATPTLFINGRPVVGLPPASMLLAMIEEEIATAKALIASGSKRADVYKALINRKSLPLAKPPTD